MRRLALLVSLLAAVAATGTAAGSLDRTPRDVVEQALAKVKPAPDYSGITRERGQPRARRRHTRRPAARGRRVLAVGFPASARDVKLNLSTAFSRSYLGSLEAAQAKAIASIHETIPEAEGEPSLPGARQRVRRQRAVRAAPGSPRRRCRRATSTRAIAYRLDLNRGPAVLGAPAFSGVTGARGQGVKVAVVDDGVDHEHPFLDPTGFSYPPGFPKGTGGGTSPKVIVARGFAGPGANRRRLDRDVSFHGTHVAGIIAGVPDGRRSRTPRASAYEAARRMSPCGQGPVGSRASRLHRQLPRLQRAGRRSAAAARRTAPRSSRPSSPQCATGWTSSTSRAAARRPIRGRTSSSRRSRTSCARASCRSSPPGTTGTTSASGRRARPQRHQMRSAWAQSRTLMSSGRR